MRIIPTSNLGQISSQEIQETLYKWKFAYTVLGSLIWLPLILVIGIFRDNRNYRITYLLIALLVVNLIWWSFLKATNGEGSSNATEFDITFQSFTIGLALLWLTAHKFSKYHGLLRIFLSLIIMTLVLIMGILSIIADFNKTTELMFILFIFVAFATLLAFAFAGKYCRKEYHPKRFMLWLVLFLPIWSMIAMAGYLLVGNAIMNSSANPLEFVMATIAGLIFGLLIYALNLPFLIMGFVSPFFRERFCACLGLKPRDLIAEQHEV